MAIVFILIPVSLVLVGLACWAFFWAVGSGQYDELDAAAWDILVDDDWPAPAVTPTPTPTPTQTQTQTQTQTPPPTPISTPRGRRA